MNNQSPWIKKPSLLAVTCLAVFAALTCLLALPSRALAAEVVAHTFDNGTRVDFFDIENAVAAGNSGFEIVMDADWQFDQSIETKEGHTLTIDMNGHWVRCSVTCFHVVRNSELVLKASTDVNKKFNYDAYAEGTGELTHVRTYTGGLVTSVERKSGGGIMVSPTGKLTLDNVAIGGCLSGTVGGIELYGDSTVTLQNGAVIEYNRGGIAGGIYCHSAGNTINLVNSSIRCNYSEGFGGGIYDSAQALTGKQTINMSEGAKIEKNTAKAGGGIYFTSAFEVTSSDGNAFISGNTARESSKTGLKSDQSGGGIHVNSENCEEKASIKNITISDNYSAYDGGGLELDQQGTSIENCKITGNWCKYEGGGIYVCNDGNVIKDCTITGNACSVDSGGNYEGGGVFVWHSYDIELQGVCVIKGNTRGKNSGNDDDVMLRENAGGSAKAYITGHLKEGSTVGVRTGCTSDRRIAKNFTSDTKDCLFYDLNGYYVSYGTDEHGDAWQRHTTKQFAAKIDGDVKACYKWRDTATLIAPIFKDDRVFWRWDTDTTQGLYPVKEYLSGDTLYSNVYTFTMPQNDVSVGTFYITRARKVLVNIDAPVAGQALPTSAKVRRDDNGIGGDGWATASVAWYEVRDDDAKVRVTSGTAKAGTRYAATVYCSGSESVPLYFNSLIAKQDVKIETPSGNAPDVSSASVDSATGLLLVETGAFSATSEGDAAPEAGGVKVNMVDGGLKAAVRGGSFEVAAAAALSDEAAAQSDRASLGEFEVSYTECADGVTISAPAQDGYNFCNWEGVDGSWLRDDVEGTVTIPYDQVSGVKEITAVYTPAVTELTVKMDRRAPEAGEKLATSATSLMIKGFDGSTFDLIDLIGAGARSVTWSPESESEDGTAGFSTSYTALVHLAKGDGFEGVEKVLAQGAVVKVVDANGENEVGASAAGFTVVDGDLCLALSFPATRDAKVTSVSQPDVIELTFEQAKACSELGAWPLQKTIDVTVESGVATEGDIIWEAVEGFDAGGAGAQELTVKGKATNIVTADDSVIDTDGVSLEVTATIEIAAPASEGGSGGADGGAAKPAATKAAKKGVPATGDTATAAPTVLLAAGAVSLASAAAVVRARREK